MRPIEATHSDLSTWEHDMTTNTHLIHAITDALFDAHGQDGTVWLECGGLAEVERGVAGWRAAIGDGAWTDRPEDILVLRALRHVEHTVELAGDARIELRIRALIDEDCHGRRRGAKARIGEVFVPDVQRCTPATLRALAMCRRAAAVALVDGCCGAGSSLRCEEHPLSQGKPNGVRWQTHQDGSSLPCRREREVGGMRRHVDC